MSCVNLTIVRNISTSAVRQGKRNFRKFQIFNKRGTRLFKEQQRINPDPDVPIDKRGVRDVGYTENGKFVSIREMVPELIVPDLTDFKLKPYVSYRAADIEQSELTAQDLFNVVYSKKIIENFKENKLNPDGSSKEPSTEEKLSAEEAKEKARQTGSDIYG